VFDRHCDNNKCHMILWESTGLYGHSSIRETKLLSGRVMRKMMLKSEHFGEGLAMMNGTFYQLIWKSGQVRRERESLRGEEGGAAAGGDRRAAGGGGGRCAQLALTPSPYMHLLPPFLSYLHLSYLHI
jgi:hypothetical protein